MKWFDNGSYAKYEFGVNPIIGKIGRMDLDKTRNIGNIFGYIGIMDLDTEPKILVILLVSWYIIFEILEVWIWIQSQKYW